MLSLEYAIPLQGGSHVSAVRHTLVTYTLGDFLGMLMLLLPALLWRRRPRSGKDAAAFQRHGIWAPATVGMLFVAIPSPPICC